MRFSIVCLLVLAGLAISQKTLAETFTDGLTLSGDDTQTISTDSTITGDIILSGNAILTISGATVQLEHTDTDPRADVIMTDSAQLIITNGSLVPPITAPDNLYVEASGSSHIDLTDATLYNVIDLADSASVTGTRADVRSSAAPFNIAETAGAFGIVQLNNSAQATFTDSTVGSFALNFTAADSATLSKLKPQLYDDFNLQTDASAISVGYNIILHNTTILPPQIFGPFERGWAIFVDPKAQVQIKNSTLNKLVFSQFTNAHKTFENLRLNQKTNFTFHDVKLTNTSIANEWGFFGQDSDITIKHGEGIWLWPMGSGNWKFKNSTMVEFDPRGFTGTLTGTNAIWDNAGEVFEQTAMTLAGDWQMTGDLDQHLVLSDSSISRTYTLTDPQHDIFSARVKFQGQTVAQASTTSGSISITVPFAADDYTSDRTLIITRGSHSKTLKLSLFKTTPITL